MGANRIDVLIWLKETLRVQRGQLDYRDGSWKDCYRLEGSKLGIID